MNKLKNIIIVVVILFISGCNHDKPRSHKVYDSWEDGVRINVVLEGGGFATLVCPMYKGGQPLGAHGIECYIQGDK